MLVTEYVVWGIPPGADGERVLVSRYPECFGRGDGPITDSTIAHGIAEACRRRGADAVRVQKVEMDDPLAGFTPPR